MSFDHKQFFHKTVQHLARSLANIKNTPWEKVSIISFLTQIVIKMHNYSIIISNYHLITGVYFVLTMSFGFSKWDFVHQL